MRLVALVRQMAGFVRRRGYEVVPHDGPHIALAHAEVDGRRHRGAGCRVRLPAGWSFLRARWQPGRDPPSRAAVRTWRSGSRLPRPPIELALDLDAENGPRSGVSASRANWAIAPDRPVRNHHRGELGARGDIRVLIGRDGLTGTPGRGDSVKRRKPLSPVCLTVGLQVRDMYRHFRRLADRDRLVNGFQQTLFLVADVRGVDPPQLDTTPASSVSSAVLA